MPLPGAPHGYRSMVSQSMEPQRAGHDWVTEHTALSLKSQKHCKWIHTQIFIYFRYMAILRMFIGSTNTGAATLLETVVGDVEA